MDLNLKMFPVALFLTLGVCFFPGVISEMSWDVCNLPSDLGTCRKDVSVKWFYNSTQQQCQMFWYGGCGGNDNRFADEDACKHHCMPHTKGTENVVITEDDSKVKTEVSTSTDKCYKPPAQGGCTNYSVKWYYDHKKTQCDRFWFGGCDGNDNRFDTEEGCEADCKRLETDDICKLPSYTGRCRARHRRWHYNSNVGECQEFIYGGCNGNANRFRSKPDCERQCISGTQALGDAPCEDSRFGCCPDGVSASQGNNNEGCPNLCQSTIYGCCDDEITAAQGINQEGCEAIEMGSGDEAPCDQADYGCCPDGVTAAQGSNEEGCDFVVEERKPDTDSGDTDITVDVSAQCKQRSDTGTCRDNLVVMWFYNTTSQRCERFWYGGCGGNNNRYKSEKECLTVCTTSVVIKAPEIPAPTIPVCEQPKEIGPCRELLRRWFHNSRTQRCEEFQYGGCRGNDNNFDSQYTCEYECGVRRGGTHQKEYEPRIEGLALPGVVGAADISKPGRCPRVYSDEDNSYCVSECHYDGDCDGNEKCCGDQAGCNKCSAPHQEPEVHISATEVCGLPKELGLCRASMSRWHYNDATRTCEQFTYGGCGGNRNNFETEETCRRYCRVDPSIGTRVRQPVCEMTPALGPCNRAVSKYFYNITTKQCEHFTYGGCLGNHNNFETEVKCNSYCGLRRADTQRETCTLRKAAGGCRGNFRHWFYEPRDGRCHEFSYGGCQGNGNNFVDEASCMAACRDIRIDEPRRVTQAPPVTRPATIRDEDVCSLPLERPCLDNRVGVFWYYDHDIGACRDIPNGECNNNRNNFQSQEQCEGYCGRNRVCQPLTYSSDRRCRAAIPRWTYDKQTQQCEEFLYGGCGGSANNFATEDACSSKCEPEPRTTPAAEVVSPDEICAQPEDSGNCLAFVRSWRYDNLDGTCKQFTFGGCGGNKNNFNSKEKCESFCNRRVVCRQFTEPLVSCLAYMPRWRYDDATGQCENFVYGGCGGNANNFDTFESCERKCITSEQPEKEVYVNRGSTWREICNMQADVGPCKQYLSKWHYSSVSQDCEQFTYGGCLGNHNNFESQEQCMTYCGDRRTVVDPVERTDVDVVDGSGEVPDNVDGVAVCHLANVTGPCEAYIRSWFYDHLAGKCAQFIYGGCGGNGNRFETRDECERRCDPREVCVLAQTSGSCMEYNTRFSFDYNSGECKEFVYGGCEGNANNFDDKDSCWQRCGRLVRDRQPPGPTGPKPGFCPPRTDWQGLLGACAPQCHDDSACVGREKCCHQGCGFRCTEPISVEPYAMDSPLRIRAQIVSPSRVYITWSDPSLGREQLIRDRRYYTVRYYSYSLGQYNYVNATDLRITLDDLRPETDYKFEVRVNNPPYLSEWSETITNRTQLQHDGPRAGYCPPKTDWRGLLGACAPQCQDDAGCQGQQKCCHHGCGMMCVDAMAMEPYSMDAPLRITIHPVSTHAMRVVWYDSDLGEDQRQRDRRYYTLRYYSNAEGMYHYVNTTDLQLNVNNLQPEAEYKFSVRANNPPYLSQWSEEAENKMVVLVRPGSCPMSGIMNGCVDECHNDGDCSGVQKCCDNGCGHQCTAPEGFNICNMAKDAGSCTDWEVRWFYNQEIARCDRFWYGGCNQGNANNFLDEDECDRQCGAVVATTMTPPVRTPVVPYDCRRSIYGCCPDGYTPARDERMSNCRGIGPEIASSTTIPVIPGESATMTCHTYSTTEDYDVAWYREGKLLESGSDHSVFPNGTLLVHTATIEDDGSYACHVHRGRENPVVYRFILQVQVPIGILDGPDMIMVKPNHMAFLHCEVYGNPTPTVTWRKDRQPIQSGGHYETFRNGTLLIRQTNENDMGVYTCTADNRVSQAVERSLKLSLREMLVARIENDNGRVTEGGRITLICEGHGYPPPTISWEKMGRPIATGGHVFISSEGHLVIREATLDDTGTYSCIVANSIEKIETSTSVQVIPKVVMEEKCVDRTSMMKCRLIVTARLCSYSMYSKICCHSCHNYFRGDQ